MWFWFTDLIIVLNAPRRLAEIDRAAGALKIGCSTQLPHINPEGVAELAVL